jgi:vacuolar protein sorting-associated protein 41
LQQHKIEDIGEKYIDFLLEQGKVVEAAVLCSKILKTDAKMWEKWIMRFHSMKQLRVRLFYYSPPHSPFNPANLHF